MITIGFSTERNADAHALVIPVAKGGLDALDLPLAQADLVKKTAGQLKFSGGTGALAGTYVTEGESLIYVLLVGTGDGEESDLTTAGGKAFTRINGQNATKADVLAGSLTGAGAAHFANGALLRSWKIDKYKTKDAAAIALETLTMVGASSDAEAAWPALQAVTMGVDLTRELVSEPANVIYPESFVERCAHLADMGVKIRVLDDKQMADLGMGALLGVAQGSRKPARMLIMEWMGGEEGKKPLVLVGKGVTFDTGGISIKAAAGMEDMKWDMGGAGAVAGAMKALAGRKAKANVIGVCGLVENMPDGNAQRPGDIVTSMAGKTIEVINTDAEGRLVLCDAITWAQKEYDPEYLIDFATLTGAIIISLGHEYAGLFSNDDGLSDMLNTSGKASGDKVWRMPIGAPYDKLIDSPIADMKNVGPRDGGSITAAQFIKRFVNTGVKWAHVDIAGMVWSAKAEDLWEKGATGYGVRLINQLVADHFEG